MSDAYSRTLGTGSSHLIGNRQWNDETNATSESTAWIGNGMDVETRLCVAKEKRDRARKVVVKEETKNSKNQARKDPMRGRV